MSTDALVHSLSKFFTSKSIAKDYARGEDATGPPGRVLLRQAGLSPESLIADTEYNILDSACGTGIIITFLYDIFKGREGQLKVTCGDISAQMVEAVKERISHFDGLQAEARELNGQALDLPSNHFTHVLTNFAIQLFKDPLLGIRESVRVAKPGGTIGMTTWVNAGWIPAFRIAVSRIPGAPASLPDPLPFLVQSGRWVDATWIRQQFEEVPDVDPATVQVEEYSFTMIINGLEEAKEFLGPMSFMLNVLAASWSKEEQEACGDGRLVNETLKAVAEERNLVWRALIITARKRT